MNGLIAGESLKFTAILSATETGFVQVIHTVEKAENKQKNTQIQFTKNRVWRKNLISRDFVENLRSREMFLIPDHGIV